MLICCKGLSLIKSFFEHGSSGGVVSTLAYCVLEMKLADGVVCLNRSAPVPHWFIAQSEKDLLAAAGSTYEDNRFCLDFSAGKLAQIGKPCNLSTAFSPRISLFCSHSYRKKNHVITKEEAKKKKSKLKTLLDNPFHCFLCSDHVGFQADVSVGDLQTKDPKINVILVHSLLGKQILDFGVNHKYLKVEKIELREIQQKQPYLWRFRK